MGLRPRLAVPRDHGRKVIPREEVLDNYMSAMSVKPFLPIFKMNFPEIVDIALPAEASSTTSSS